MNIYLEKALNKLFLERTDDIYGRQDQLKQVDNLWLKYVRMSRKHGNI